MTENLHDTISIIIPAYNEADRISETIDAVIKAKLGDEIVVVDDGSTDDTSRIAASKGVKTVRLERNGGKGAALNAGLPLALGSIIVFLDADLAMTASNARPIVDAVRNNQGDLAIGAFSTPGGFGLVLKFARLGIKLLCGYEARAPLSGQRAFRREVLQAIYPMRTDFGVETAMIIDAVRSGFSIIEVPVDMGHRSYGRTLRGFVHRAHQGMGVFFALFSCFIRYDILRVKRSRVRDN